VHHVLPGKIILINGASSSGKSTLARAVQRQLDEPFWHLSIDHLRESGVLTLDRVRAGDFLWKSNATGILPGVPQCLASGRRSGQQPYRRSYR
jgi:chloramphenicol 3-O phosphotransferase